MAGSGEYLFVDHVRHGFGGERHEPICDGGCSTQSRVYFTKADPGVVDRVSVVAGTFGWSLTPLEADPITHRITRVGAYEGKASPSAFVRRFNMDKKSIEKVVPPEVFQARDTVLARFIGAYFSCDGSVNLPIGQAPRLELAAKKSLRLFQDLLAAQVSVYDHFGDVGVKNQLKQAELYKSPIALIMGQKEAMDEMVILRDVKSGMQEIFSYDKIVIEVKKRLGK
jgi:hypothetical protein